VAIAADVAFFAAGLLTAPEANAKGQWTLVVFIGGILSIAKFMNTTGVSAWLASLLGPIFAPIMSSPYIFVPCLCIITFALRYVIVSQTCMLTMMIAIFGPLMEAHGMSMFIMRRDKLIQIIREMVPHGKYHFERDFILPEYNAGNLKVNVYPFHNVALFNQSVDEYFVNNMKLLDADVRRSLFRSEIPIYTKVRDAVPTLFGYNGQAANCLIADGCHLFGKAENSVIFREVDIEEGAEVRDSIVMQGSRIGAGASIRYCILDKNVTIRPGTKLLGSKDHPLVVDKGDTV